MLPSVVLLHIWEVLGSNIIPETGYPERFLWFFSDPPGKFRDITLN
jgi:hypothetical protein